MGRLPCGVVDSGGGGGEGASFCKWGNFVPRAYFYLRREKRPSRHARPLARLQRPSYRTRVCATHLVRAAVRRASGARPNNDDSCTLFSLSVNSRPKAVDDVPLSPDPTPQPQIRRRRRRFRSRSTRTLWRSHVLGRSSPASTRNALILLLTHTHPLAEPRELPRTAESEVPRHRLPEHRTPLITLRSRS